MTDKRKTVEEGALDSILQGAKNVASHVGNSMLAPISAKHDGRVDNLTVARRVSQDWKRFVGRSANGKLPATAENVSNFVKNQYGNGLSDIINSVLGNASPQADNADGSEQDSGDNVNPKNSSLPNANNNNSAIPDPATLANNVMGQAGEAASSAPASNPTQNNAPTPKEAKINGLVDQMLLQPASPANNAKISAALAERLKMVTDAPSAHRAAGFMYDMIQRHKEANPRAAEMMMQMYKKMTPDPNAGIASEQNAAAPSLTQNLSSTPMEVGHPNETEAEFRGRIDRQNIADGQRRRATMTGGTPALSVDPAARTPISSPQNAAAPVRTEPTLNRAPSAPNLSVVPSGPRERTPTSFSNRPSPQGRREPSFGTTPPTTPPSNPVPLGNHRNERTPTSFSGQRRNVRPVRRDPPPLSRNMGESFVPDMKTVMKAVREVLAATRQSNTLKTPQAVLEAVNNSPRIASRLYPAMSAIHESQRDNVLAFAKYLKENSVITKRGMDAAYDRHFGKLNELAGMGRDSVWQNAPEMASRAGAARMPGAPAGAAAANPMDSQTISPYEQPNGSAAPSAQPAQAAAHDAQPSEQNQVLSAKVMDKLFKSVAAYLLAHGIATVKDKPYRRGLQRGLINDPDDNGRTNPTSQRSNTSSGTQAQPAPARSNNTEPSKWQTKTLSTLDQEFHKISNQWSAGDYKTVVSAIRKTPDADTMRNFLNANPRLLASPPAKWLMRFISQ